MVTAYVFTAAAILGAVLAFGAWSVVGGQLNLQITAYLAGMAVLLLAMGKIVGCGSRLAKPLSWITSLWLDLCSLIHMKDGQSLGAGPMLPTAGGLLAGTCL